MDVYQTLREIKESEELKTVTSVTRSVKDSAEKLLNLDEGQKMHFCDFATSMDQALTTLVKSARNRKSVTSKLDKLYPMFHEFSITKGFELCHTCEKVIDCEVPEILWQMLMEKEFMKHLYTELCPTVNDSSACSASSDPHHTLSVVESNAVRYVGEWRN